MWKLVTNYVEGNREKGGRNEREKEKGNEEIDYKNSYTHNK